MLSIVSNLLIIVGTPQTPWKSRTNSDTHTQRKELDFTLRRTDTLISASTRYSRYFVNLPFCLLRYKQGSHALRIKTTYQEQKTKTKLEQNPETWKMKPKQTLLVLVSVWGGGGGGLATRPITSARMGTS